MSKLRINIKKYLNLRTVLLTLILLAISLIWGKYLVGIILVIFFAPISFLTVRYSKMIPHVSAESNTAMACYMGYVFGPAVGFFYGLAVGGFSYVMNSFVSITYLSTVLLAGIAAVITGILHAAGMGFTQAFILGIIIRTIIAWPWFTFVGISPFESFTHQSSQMFFNIIIYLPLLSVVHGLILHLL